MLIDEKFLINCLKISEMKKSVKIIGVVLLIALCYLGFTTYPKLDLISGFSAKSVASGHFIDNRYILKGMNRPRAGFLAFREFVGSPLMTNYANIFLHS